MIEEMCENVELILSFAEKAGISLEAIPNYCLTRDSLSYTIEKSGVSGVKDENEEFFENVSITLNNTIDKSKVKKKCHIAIVL